MSRDRQFIHLDAQAAAADATAFWTIAHGFPLLVPMANDVLPTPSGLRMAVNYGFEKVRFLNPVPSGARVRGQFLLKHVTHRAPGHILQTHEETIEIEGAEKPALVAEWMYLLAYFKCLRKN